MKKLIIFAFAAMFVLAGCNLLAQDPIIGSWETTILGVTTNYVFIEDGSCIGIATALGVSVTTNGVWNSDSTTLTITWSGSADNEVDLYSFLSLIHI